MIDLTGIPSSSDDSAELDYHLEAKPFGSGVFTEHPLDDLIETSPIGSEIVDLLVTSGHEAAPVDIEFHGFDADGESTAIEATEVVRVIAQTEKKC